MRLSGLRRETHATFCRRFRVVQEKDSAWAFSVRTSPMTMSGGEMESMPIMSEKSWKLANIEPPISCSRDDVSKRANTPNLDGPEP
jgi:hypothetical protein